MKKGIGYHQVGDSFDNLLLIKDATRGVASNGKAFLTLILGDTSGEIEAKLWDAKKEDETTYIPETIVHITGEVNQFRGRSQLKIMSIRPTEASEGYDVNDFLERAPVEKDVLAEKLTETIFEMENPVLQRMVRGFIKKYQSELLTFPAAAKNHHEYVSGLAHHIVSMLALGKQLHQLYPELNKDLLYAGIILHDLGKLKELSGAVTTSYTLEGKLIGHIPIMVEEIGHMARELQIDEKEEVLILQHLVLSHHQKAEWGSPRPPLVREGELLHLIDMIDAKMNTLNRALDKVNPGEFTERLFPLDNRSFYKPLFENH